MTFGEATIPFAQGMRALVHPSIPGSPDEAAKHQSFIATRLVGGGAALAGFPLYLVFWGAPDIVGAVAFAWLMTPLAAALYLSRTGRLEDAQILSAIGFAGLIGWLASATGGLASPLLPWLLMVPAEAALTGARRVVKGAALAAFVALLALFAVTAYAGPPAAEVTADGAIGALPLLGLLPGILYLGTLMSGAATPAPPAGQSFAAPTDAGELVRHCPDIITRHRRNGNLTFLSPAAEMLLPVPQEELLGDGLFRRIHVGDRPTYLKALDDAANGDIPTVAFRMRGEDGEGSDWLWIEMSCRALPGGAPEERDVAAILRDVTTRKSLERNLAEAFEEVERESLAKTRFLARISHELRTPLNAIIGFSEILCREMYGRLDQDKHREHAELIRDSGRHLLDLINDILDMSKIESGTFQIVREPFDVAELVRNCVQVMGPQAEAAGLGVETDVPVAPQEVAADRRACKQIMLNLIHNAVKFSDQGGRIVAGAFMEGETACLYVADEGIGIHQEDVRRLGQPFLQLHGDYDRNYEGAGLGLSVVKGLVALHDGDLEIDSRPGRGTRVTVRLPLSSDRQEGQASDPVRLTA